MPSSRPWRRSTSWQPGMQPAKSLATSKKALLQSVTRESSASSSSSIRPAATARWIRSSICTAPRVQTLQCPSRPPRMRTRHRLAVALHRERREQVEHDVVVVAGVERDAVLGARGHHAADHVERAVAVEGRHLDRDDVVDRGEAAPELHRQGNAADRGLQVEADQRDHLRDRLAVRDQLVDRRALHRRRATAGRRDSRCRARPALRGRPARCGRQGRRSSPAAGRSIRAPPAPPARAPARRGRRRGSRTASRARRPPGRRSRHRGSSGVSARWRDGSSLRCASSASGCAGMAHAAAQQRERLGGQVGPVKLHARGFRGIPRGPSGP